MKCVPISQLAPDQRLARPITTKDGAVLCPAGLTLTDTIIRRLANTGIDLAFVESDDDGGPTAAKRLSDLEERFEGVTSPLLLELKHTIAAYFQKVADDM